MKIEKIKKIGSKYKIILDNGKVINTFDDVILKNNLLYGKNIDSELLNKINTDTIYYTSYNKALSMISRKLRSEQEINAYLEKSEALKEEQEKIINTLKNIGLINDYNFAKAFTNDKINLTLDGPDKIAKSLDSHKIDEYIIKEVIDSISHELIDERLEKIINKKLKANKKYSGYILKQKLFIYLINLGYSKNDIQKHLIDLKLNDDLTQIQMEKIYKQLSKKYQEEKLILKFKNKLYSKGFSSEEINDYLNKKQL